MNGREITVHFFICLIKVTPVCVSLIEVMGIYIRCFFHKAGSKMPSFHP